MSEIDWSEWAKTAKITVDPVDWQGRALAAEAAAEGHRQRAERAEAQVIDVCDALRLTVEYVGPGILPPVEGWSWFDALSKHAPDMAQQFAALFAPEPAAGSAHHPDATDTADGHAGASTGWQRGFDADAVQP